MAPQGKAGERAQDRDPTLHSDTAVKRRARKNELSMAKPSIPVLSSVCKRRKKTCVLTIRTSCLEVTFSFCAFVANLLAGDSR